MTRLREQLNVLRAEMDAGFIKYNNALDASSRTGARAEALGKSLEALVCICICIRMLVCICMYVYVYG